MSGNFPTQSGVFPGQSGVFPDQSGTFSGQVRDFLRTSPGFAPDKSGVFAGWEMNLRTGSGQVRIFPDKSGFSGQVRVFSGQVLTFCRRSAIPLASPESEPTKQRKCKVLEGFWGQVQDSLRASPEFPGQVRDFCRLGNRDRDRTGTSPEFLPDKSGILPDKS